MMLGIFEGLDNVTLDIILPIALLLIFFLVFQFLFLKRPLRQVLVLLRGLLFAFVGLVLFLQGINIAFVPMGQEIGSAFGGFDNTWTLIPLGFVLGFFITLAEPQVRVLSQTVEEASSGYIRSKTILILLCLAVATFTALAMARTVFGIPLHFVIIPGYLIAVILLFFADKDFVAMAFDSGSIATGPLTVAFMVSLTVGVSDALDGRNMIVDGFGLIGIITLAPIISIQLLSLIYAVKTARGEVSDDSGK
ncbi:MAG: DUF1538 domain-containing protein [Dehalococcoidales bacterium]|jgi:hypothetical protein|nr:DUF1538 domain-containing protein [Limnochordia bacterium]MDD2252476.1 DUF1538 domain-containing protein [Dehalococcoidales bacterium]MDD5499012.1 DUF1538 domain-containing protein [Dehalococcoidales bacterium]